VDSTMVVCQWECVGVFSSVGRRFVGVGRGGQGVGRWGGRQRGVGGRWGEVCGCGGGRGGREAACVGGGVWETAGLFLFQRVGVVVR